MHQRSPRFITGCLTASLLVLLLAGWPASAQERIPGFSSGVTFGGGTIFHDDYDFGLSARAFAEYAPFIHEIGLRLTGGYLRFENYITIGQRPFSSREQVLLENSYATLGAVYRFSRSRFVPFATANVGAYRYEKEDVYPAAGPVINGQQYSPYNAVRVRTGTTFGANIGGGVEYFFDETLSMSTELLLHRIQGEVSSQVLELALSFRFLPKK